MDDYLCEYSDFIVDDYTFVIIWLLLVGFCLIIGLCITCRINENRRKGTILLRLRQNEIIQRTINSNFIVDENTQIYENIPSASPPYTRY
jgi:hypothetical protein